MVDAFHSRRDLVVGLLKEIPGIKSMFQKVLLCISRRIFVLRKTLRGTLIKTLMTLLCIFREANVATVTGDAFGNPDCIRFLCYKRRNLERSFKE
jgi:aspartate aminotransferase